MENKIIVEKGTFEYNDKEYSSYFIAGKIKGKDVKVALMPPDKGGSARYPFQRYQSRRTCG